LIIDSRGKRNAGKKKLGRVTAETKMEKRFLKILREKGDALPKAG
jgi:hypothetical protein